MQTPRYAHQTHRTHLVRTSTDCGASVSWTWRGWLVCVRPGKGRGFVLGEETTRVPATMTMAMAMIMMAGIP